MASVYAAEPTGAPKKSPFMPSGAAAASPAAATNQAIEFAGVSSVGNRTDLIFHDKGAKKNRWVGVGETVEGISVMSYDSRREEAVVKINGEQKTLALRKGGRTVHAPATAPVATLPDAAGFAVPAHLPGAEPFQTVQGTSNGSMSAAQAQAGATRTAAGDRINGGDLKATTSGVVLGLTQFTHHTLGRVAH